MYKALLLALVVLVVAGAALAGSTPQPSVGAEIAELGCTPSAQSSKSALDGVTCRTLGYTMFRFDASAAQIQQALGDLTTAQDSLKDQLSNLQDLSNDDFLELQAAMNRRSLFIQTLTNIMKKIEETQSSIIQNIK